MSVAVLIVVAVAIPLALVAGALVANSAAGATEQPLSRRKRLAIQAFLVILSLAYGAMAVFVGVEASVDRVRGSSLALVLILLAFGMGPAFQVVQLARPHLADDLRKRRYVAQGYAFIASGVCWAAASLTEVGWLAVYAFAFASLGVAYVYLATHRHEIV